MINPDTAPFDSLSLYDSAPVSRFGENAEYIAATEKYGENDFRFSFTEKYKAYLNGLLGIPVFNCRLERPRKGCGFVNFTVYLLGASVRDLVSEDTEKICSDAFFHVLEQNPLPSLSADSPVHFFVSNVKSVMYRRILDRTWRLVGKAISVEFPEVDSISFWSELYVFVKDDCFDRILADARRLEAIKRYCYDNAKKHDDNNILTYDDFRIRADNCKNYNSVGGGQYFRSDLMFDCPLI